MEHPIVLQDQEYIMQGVVEELLMQTQVELVD
jgi:hypothetical protein